jgi:hypothetical protein
MAECSRCGDETDLYLLGIAICPQCDELLKQLAVDLTSKQATPELFLVKNRKASA